MVCDPRRLVRVLLRVVECRVGGTPGLAEQRIAAYIDQRRALDCRVDRPQLPAAPLEPAELVQRQPRLGDLVDRRPERAAELLQPLEPALDVDAGDRKSTRLTSTHSCAPRLP